MYPQLHARTWVNSSASQRAISSDASGCATQVSTQPPQPLFTLVTTDTSLIRREQVQQRLQHHFNRVHIFLVIPETTNQWSKRPRCHRCRIDLGKTPQPQDRCPSIFQQRHTLQPTAQRIDRVRSRLLGRRLRFEYSEHRRR